MTKYLLTCIIDYIMGEINLGSCSLFCFMSNTCVYLAIVKYVLEYILRYIENAENVIRKEPIMKQKIIGVTELQRRFRQFFDQVAKKNIPIILTRGSRPEAALIPYEDYLRLQELKESDVLARFDQVWDRLGKMNESYTEAEIEAYIKAARQITR